MAVGKGSMERAAKTAAKTAEAKPAVAKATEEKPVATKTKTAAKPAAVKSTVIAKPVEEVLVKAVVKQKKSVAVQHEEAYTSVQVGDEMPIYYY